MAQDKSAPYIIGQMTALTESIIGKENLPEAFAAIVDTNALDKLPYWVDRAIKQSGNDELTALARFIGDNYRFVGNVAHGQYWLGYYHKKDEIFRQSVGRQLTRVRRQRGLTQRELAQKCGITQNNISNIENGLTNTTLDTLHKLSSALDFQLTLTI